MKNAFITRPEDDTPRRRWLNRRKLDPKTTSRNRELIEQATTTAVVREGREFVLRKLRDVVAPDPRDEPARPIVSRFGAARLLA